MMELHFHKNKINCVTSVDCEEFGDISQICLVNFNILLINIYWKFFIYS